MPGGLRGVDIGFSRAGSMALRDTKHEQSGRWCLSSGELPERVE
jgi:hypothetical protein